ncbi:immunoglobulin domain-containing protein [Actomonas aquatica]|uniref:Immunoglobulin domain-containing protein n=1 Tax=Actomonas aquatica TaxID=2866162 RepID=A0ABZ1C3L9_9BACT|nr:immunoglobulin domain-containing protein [Opitutus sp. WL0086]WRQ86200.1 immunoglobulin domain-containing protein [Opitutus sp. WL0086]
MKKPSPHRMRVVTPLWRQLTVGLGLSLALSLAAQAAIDTVVVTPNQIVNAGEPADMEAITTPETGAFRFQWYHDGEALPGATERRFRIDSTTTADAGLYHVTASEDEVSLASAPVALEVLTPAPPAVFLSGDPDLELNYGSALSIYPVVQSALPVTYAWTKNGEPYSSDLFLRIGLPSYPTDAGEYVFTATNAAGSSSLPPFHVTAPANTAPRITLLSAPASLSPGDDFGVFLYHTGTPPMTVELLHNDDVIATQETWVQASFDIPNITAANLGTYRVRLTNVAGEITSDPWELAFREPDPLYLRIADGERTLFPGKSLTLLATSNITDSTQIQWFRNGLPIPDETHWSLRVDTPGNYRVEDYSTGKTLRSDPVIVVQTLDTPRPIFVRQPSDQVLIPGSSNHYIRVAAQCSLPYSLQWYHNGMALPDATSSTLQLSPNLAGTVHVVATTSEGTSTRSLDANISIMPDRAPTILAHPSSRIVDEGQRSFEGVGLTFDFVPFGENFYVTGSPQPTLQWYKDGQLLAEATGSSLRFSEVTLDHAGTYHVVATNSVGSVQSEPATLTVQPYDGPKIYQQPNSLELIAGSSGRLQIVADSTYTLTYQWFKDDVALADGQSAQLDLTGAGPADAGTYHVLVSNKYGSTRSADTTVHFHRLADHPVLRSVSGDVVAAYGYETELEAAPYAPSLDVQWTLNGAPITQPLLRTSPTSLPLTVSEDTVGTYTATVTTPDGTVTTREIEVSRLTSRPHPRILRQSGSMPRSIDQPVRLYVHVSGEEPFAYQWYHKGEPLTDETGPELEFPHFTAAAAGDYHVEITNAWGSITSQTMRLTLQEDTAPVIISHPASQTITDPTALPQLSVTARSLYGANFFYQWHRSPEPFDASTDTTGATLRLPPDEPFSGTYYVTVTNRAVSRDSRPAVITTLFPTDPPVIVEHPAAQTVYAGTTATFSVTATSDAELNLSYQWLLNGTPVANATSATLELAAVLLSDDGYVTAQVHDGTTLVSSNAARLEVLPPSAPAFILQPEGRSIPAGETATLSVAASGDPTPTYQWRRDGRLIAGATGPTLTLPDFNASLSGNYTVIASNPFGHASSQTARLDLAIAPGTLVARHEAYRARHDGRPRVWIRNTVDYEGSPDQLTLQALLPAGWTFISIESSTTATSSTEPGDTDLAEWTWTGGPISVLHFTYLLENTSGAADAELVTRIEASFDGSLTASLANPDPLILPAPPTRHDSDLNDDGQIELSELLRAIELYNTRSGTTRTGRYRLNAETPDGVEADPTALTPPTGERPILARFHSADTNRDAELSLSELLRIIEFYNHRSGTTRTGAYHLDSTTLDGFAPGPN